MDVIEVVHSLEQKAQALVEAVESEQPTSEIAHSARGLLTSLITVRRVAERDAEKTGKRPTLGE